MRTRRAFLTILLLLCCSLRLAQAQTRTVTYTSKNGKIVAAADAYYFSVKEGNESGGGIVTRFLAKDTTKVDQTTYRLLYDEKNKDGIAHGPHYEWYQNGKLKVQAAYVNDTLSGEYRKWYESGQLQFVRKHKSYFQLQDTLRAYYESGALRRIEVYSDKGELDYGKLYSETGEELKFFPMEQMPVFPGGENVMLRWLAMNVKYPKVVRKAEAQGMVVVSFEVGEDGYIQDAEVIRGFHPDADAEALRVINKMPKWKPGLQEGKPTAVRYVMPFNFTIK